MHLSGRRVLVSRRLISGRRLRGSLSRRVRLIWSRALARRRRRLVLLRRCAGLVRRLACRVLLARLLLAGLGLSGADLPLTRRWGLGTRRRCLGAHRGLRLADALVRLLAQPGGHAKARNRAGVDAAGDRNPLLPLKPRDGLAGLRAQDAVGFTV